jgi:predicted nucleotidyltransferase
MSIIKLYKKEIEKISKKIKEKYKPERIILFGSCASSKIKPSSDIDC